MVDSFINHLSKVDQQSISNIKKANYLTTRLNWPFLVYDIGKSLLAKLDSNVIKTLKSWLGLAHSADPSTLFGDQNNFGMKLKKKTSGLYKHLGVTKMYVLGKSQDDVVKSLPKDESATELESRLQFHKQFVAGTQLNRLGLGPSKKKEDQDVIKSLLQQDENDTYRMHVFNLEMQNEWLTIGEFPLSLTWRALIHNWSPDLLKFYLNAFQMTLPDQSNLVRCGKASEICCYT